MSLPGKVVLASGNAGKLREIRALLAPRGVELIPQTELGVGSVPETGLTFVENALIKARHAARVTGHAAIADDSGIAVDALGGQPGIYSAHYAGTHGDNAANNAKLLAALTEFSAPGQRTARFICVVVLLRAVDDPTPIICQGVWRGRIAAAPRGDQGFGYDPLFEDPATGLTGAEMDPAAKNRVSHRGQALAALQQQLDGERSQ